MFYNCAKKNRGTYKLKVRTRDMFYETSSFSLHIPSCSVRAMEGMWAARGNPGDEQHI